MFLKNKHFCKLVGNLAIMLKLVLIDRSESDIFFATQIKMLIKEVWNYGLMCSHHSYFLTQWIKYEKDEVEAETKNDGISECLVGDVDSGNDLGGELAVCQRHILRVGPDVQSLQGQDSSVID